MKNRKNKIMRKKNEKYRKMKKTDLTEVPRMPSGFAFFKKKQTTNYTSKWSRRHPKNHDFWSSEAHFGRPKVVQKGDFFETRTS